MTSFNEMMGVTERQSEDLTRVAEILMDPDDTLNLQHATAVLSILLGRLIVAPLMADGKIKPEDFMAAFTKDTIQHARSVADIPELPKLVKKQSGRP